VNQSVKERGSNGALRSHLSRRLGEKPSLPMRDKRLRGASIEVN